MVARDGQRAMEFYEAVLLVPFSSGRPGAWRTDETKPPLAIWSPEGAEPEVQLSYRVDDIAAAVERVRAAGGRADAAERKPFGLLAECVDDQGTVFRLWQPVDCRYSASLTSGCTPVRKDRQSCVVAGNRTQ
jgi:predicted enzyme related to lactoylglutathione lyase